mmetsp:Transcript_70469/g.229120  ORF Transcript_70469/g.229120 Transcript_70469/m.229120 type:complete len:226 (-) Transcript_70469:1060-1737(-)
MFHFGHGSLELVLKAGNNLLPNSTARSRNTCRPDRACAPKSPPTPRMTSSKTETSVSALSKSKSSCTNFAACSNSSPNPMSHRVVIESTTVIPIPPKVSLPLWVTGWSSSRPQAYFLYPVQACRAASRTSSALDFQRASSTDNPTTPCAGAGGGTAGPEELEKATARTVRLRRSCLNCWADALRLTGSNHSSTMPARRPAISTMLPSSLLPCRIPFEGCISIDSL